MQEKKHDHVADEAIIKAVEEGLDSQAVQNLRLAHSNCENCLRRIEAIVQAKQIEFLNIGAVSHG